MNSRSDLEVSDAAFVDFMMDQLRQDCTTEMLERLYALIGSELQDRDMVGNR